MPTSPKTTSSHISPETSSQSANFSDFDSSNVALETALVHGGVMRSGYGELSEAMFLTQGFVYPSAEAAAARFNGEDPGFVYSRYANPTVRMFEERMCALEGAQDARATASGMAAVSTAMLAALQAGDHVVAAQALFGSCRYIVESFLPRFGVQSTLVDGRDLSAWKAAIRPNTKVLFLETPTNPTLEVVDIQAVAKLAKSIGARLIVDNVFATPLWQKPLALGADVVVYSATKHIDGQGRCLGGVILSDRAWIEEAVAPVMKHCGPAMSPFNAWVLLKGLETLPIRVERQTQTANTLATALKGHAAVAKVIYPGHADHPQADVIARQMTAGSTLIAFDLTGGQEAAFRFCNCLKIICISNNLGDAKSIITHPATTTHQRLSAAQQAALSIFGGTLRLSCGLENADDLTRDLLQALDQVGKPA